MQKLDVVWFTILIWLSISLVIYLLIGEYSIPLFALTYGILYLSFLWYFRDKIRAIFSRYSDSFTFFVFVSLISVTVEELWCWLAGGTLARSIIWQDLLVVSISWVPWFLVWKYYLSKKFAWSDKEAMLVAGFTGILFELVPKLQIFANLIATIIILPTIIIVYSAVFLLPMLAMNFTGKNNVWYKYPLAIFIPYVASVAFYLFAAVLLFPVVGV